MPGPPEAVADDMTYAIQYTEFGGPEVLTLVEIPTPVPGEGEVLVHVEAVGVNPLEGKQRSALRPTGPITTPRRPGADAAGVVAAIGTGVEGLRVGEPVVVFTSRGTYASDVIAPASHVQPRPPAVSAEQGAALGIPIGTAYQTLRSLAVGAGDTLLIHGGSGAVGQAMIQFARMQGATVVATCSPRRFERVESIGATPVAYGPGVEDRIRAAAPQGVTVAVDIAGTDEALESSLALVSDHQRIATLVMGFKAAGLGIRAFSGGSPVPLTAQESAWRAEGIPVALALLATGGFTVEVGPSFPLADAADAHRAVEAGVDGKVILIP
ncbi:quinone oxidoreductase family protein [Microbacterium sp. ASV49]|uniref:NADP-dependent oxidoreductase n=1 Tax=Microbacterium candidum TaxID=3041922 RepID=A0ABT7N1Q9_9MICO|nr:NADP-dependent oxidoreductase [Microbacterium sp. ASV49]MDL9980652.1 NADP-dependent oxidoreductase [Microbacterium sp. ASV49]